MFWSLNSNFGFTNQALCGFPWCFMLGLWIWASAERSRSPRFLYLLYLRANSVLPCLHESFFLYSIQMQLFKMFYFAIIKNKITSKSIRLMKATKSLLTDSWKHCLATSTCHKPFVSNNFPEKEFQLWKFDGENLLPFKISGNRFW